MMGYSTCSRVRCISYKYAAKKQESCAGQHIRHSAGSLPLTSATLDRYRIAQKSDT